MDKLTTEIRQLQASLSFANYLLKRFLRDFDDSDDLWGLVNLTVAVQEYLEANDSSFAQQSTFKAPGEECGKA